MSRTPKAVPMACITIGYRDYLMPSDKAMKVAELMQSAFECSKNFADRGYTYTPGEQPAVEFVFVKPSEVRKPAPPEAPRQIGMSDAHSS